LWGWGKEDKKIAWVRWTKLCQCKEEGGLQISITQCLPTKE